MAHDFVKFPELTNSQMEFYYFDSPHKQIFEDFRATVVKVHDGDTITVRSRDRNFDFPIRFLDSNAPELNEPGGKQAQSWLESKILNDEVDILIDSNRRVGKWGRLLGRVIHKGSDLVEESIVAGFATAFDNRNEGKIPNISKALIA